MTNFSVCEVLIHQFSRWHVNFCTRLTRTNHLDLASKSSNPSKTLFLLSGQIWPRSWLTARECLSSARASKIHPVSMEKCWFSLCDCIRLSSALLTGAVGCEAWKLVGRGISLGRFHLRTLCSLHTFHKVMRHLYTFGMNDRNYKSRLLCWLWKPGLGCSAGNYCAHKGALTKVKPATSELHRGCIHPTTKLHPLCLNRV